MIFTGYTGSKIQFKIRRLKIQFDQLDFSKNQVQINRGTVSLKSGAKENFVVVDYFATLMTKYKIKESAEWCLVHVFKFIT